MLHIIQAVVDEELELGDDAELLADARTEFVAHLSLVSVDVLHYLLCLLAWEYAEIDTAHAQVGTDAADADADQYTTHCAGLLLEDVAQFLLDEACYFVLSGCFHLIYLLFDDLLFTIYSPYRGSGGPYSP